MPHAVVCSWIILFGFAMFCFKIGRKWTEVKTRGSWTLRCGGNNHFFSYRMLSRYWYIVSFIVLLLQCHRQCKLDACIEMLEVAQNWGLEYFDGIQFIYYKFTWIRQLNYMFFSNRLEVRYSPPLLLGLRATNSLDLTSDSRRSAVSPGVT